MDCVSDVMITVLGVSQVSQKGCKQSGQCSWICRTLSSLFAPCKDGAPPVNDKALNGTTYVRIMEETQFVSEHGSSEQHKKNSLQA